MPKKTRRVETAHCMMALNASGEGALRTIPLIPKPLDDGTVPGRDGRYWKMLDLPAVLSASAEYIAQYGAPLDEGHKMFINPEGAPAFGWFQSFSEGSDGAISGQCELTDLGATAIDNKHYRFASVVFDFDLDTLEILVIRGAGLTNKQNLQVPALNNQQPPKEDEMNPKLLAALGITPSGDDAKDLTFALNAIQQLKDDKATALNAQGTLVPKAQLDEATSALNAAKTKLEQIEGAAFKAKVQAALNSASEAGKLTPAARAKWAPTLTDETALNNFSSVMEAMPVLTKDQTAPAGDPPDGGTALNAAEKELGDVFGNSAEDLKKYGN